VQSHELILLFRTNAHFHSGSRVHSDKRRKPVCEYLVKIFPRRYSDSRAQRRRTYLVQTRTSNRNEFTFNIGCVVSIFDTLVFVARSGGHWANLSSIERKKKSRKWTGAPWIYASSYVPWIVPWSAIHHLTIPHYELGVLQFKIPNEHKFDRLLTSTHAVFDENEYISTRFAKKILLGVTFRQAKIKSNYAGKKNGNFSKRTKVCANFYRVIRIIDFRRWKKFHHVEK